ncbi:membrane-spanning 4-domains subfamily A member 4A-like [Pygocentrus nattereri]|uniref:membrane-spanning 4-domains subfamily A member 4A-like n=1 Tax=Pygocentrus nattereri TaxID=42514 RepID=UPI001891D846|nr:membrane-spanning 4-domains subfamily A member 4A-like [Pygocentrus nattereri]
MSTTVVPVENMKNCFTIISHVVPTQTAGNEQHRAAAPAGAPTFTRISAFLKGEPKALGTVQIMIGVVTFLFAIVLTANISNISTYSGMYYWGALIYISAGSLAVAAENKLHPCVVKGSLGMNVISAITAGIAIVLLSLDLAFGPINYGPCYPEYDHYFECHTAFRLFKSRNNGITGVLLFFSLIQFIISICISVFGCKVICNDEILEQAAVNLYAVPIPVSSIENSQLCSNMELPPEESPPAYTENAN